jgi:hypothetical protein
MEKRLRYLEHNDDDIFAVFSIFLLEYCCGKLEWKVEGC